ncbi:uncharacterized protein CG5098-like [Stomoxys calcitrans]|uniref:uncharacterized protein CG5098-like n=2 Tax=Stomoxys calcitrans TaxID=35570 RepID=UPI0027E2C1D6|nr:uncharacterized protein CG5098-like [Stomoxys calcitrans]
MSGPLLQRPWPKEADSTKSYKNKQKSSELNVGNSDFTSESKAIKSPDKRRFEEVEIKLEEMFAGIDDEQSSHLNVKGDTSTANKKSNPGNNNAGDVSVTEKTLQTKAAVKCTEYALPSTTINCSSPLNEKSMDEKIVSKSIQNKLPPRRPSISIEQQMNHAPEIQNDFKSSGPHLSKPISMQKHDNTNDTNLNANTLSNNKNKSAGNNKKQSNDTKMDTITKAKSKHKKNMRNETVHGSMKWKQQKFKTRHLGNCSSSDHDNEPDEKVQHSRDMEIKYRSPFILIKSDGQVSIVNTPSFDECADKTNKLKKTGSYERKNARGTYSSTLSNKYDADTADSTWICVFCKRGPHKKGLGDLFGPYYVAVDCDDYKHTANMNMTNSTSESKHSYIGTPTNYVNNVSPYSKKVTANQTVYEPIVVEKFGGYRTLEDDLKSIRQNGIHNAMPNNIEVWFHEDCGVWAPNLFLAGSRLVGLESAIWNSSFHKCILCEKMGATICCLERECEETVHLVCARENAWVLDESKLWSHCAKHA